MEKVLELAALLGALKIIGDYLKPLWKVIRKPIKKGTARVIDKLIKFLVWIKRFLKDDDSESKISSNNGVTGGVVGIIRK